MVTQHQPQNYPELRRVKLDPPRKAIPEPGRERFGVRAIICAAVVPDYTRFRLAPDDFRMNRLSSWATTFATLAADHGLELHTQMGAVKAVRRLSTGFAHEIATRRDCVLLLNGMIADAPPEDIVANRALWQRLAMASVFAAPKAIIASDRAYDRTEYRAGTLKQAVTARLLNDADHVLKVMTDTYSPTHGQEVQLLLRNIRSADEEEREGRYPWSDLYDASLAATEPLPSRPRS